jgi:hypothetical protein
MLKLRFATVANPKRRCMKKILLMLSVFVYVYIPFANCVEIIGDQDFHWKVQCIRENQKGNIWMIMKNSEYNTFAMYEFTFIDYLGIYDDQYIYYLHDFALKCFLENSTYLPLDEAQKIFPIYGFTKENYGF